MKMQSLKVLVIALVLGLLTVFGSASPAYAQSGEVAVFDVSFDFEVGNQTIKAGRYNLRRTGTGVFLLFDRDGKQTMLIPGTATLAPEKTSDAEKLIFNRYGDRYFLRGIYAERRAAGFGVSESKAEKKVRQTGGADAEKLARITVKSTPTAYKN
jgi:hypothetical protein